MDVGVGVCKTQKISSAVNKQSKTPPAFHRKEAQEFSSSWKAPLGTSEQSQSQATASSIAPPSLSPPAKNPSPCPRGYREQSRQLLAAKPHQVAMPARALLSDHGHRAVLPPFAPRRRADTTERSLDLPETLQNLSSPLLA